MKSINKYALGFFIGTFFAAMPSLAALTSIDKAEIYGPITLIKNGGFENGKSKWTASGGSFSTATSGTNWLVGASSGVFNASSASQTLTNEAVTITTATNARLDGTKGYASCEFKTTATDYKLQVWDGTTVLNEATIPSSSVKAETGVYFPVPLTGTLALRIISGSDAADLAIDKCHMGSAPTPQVPYDGLVGTLTVSGCAADWSSTNTSYTTPAAQASCVYTLEGLALAPTTNLAAIRFASLQAGEYAIVVSGYLYGGTVSTQNAYRIFDGTNASRDAVHGIADGTIYPSPAGTSHFSIKYSTAQTNVTLALQIKTSGGGTGYIGQTYAPMTIKVYRTNSIADTGFSFDTTASSWSGYHTSGGASWSRTNTAYGTMTPTGTAAIVERLNTNFGTVTTAGTNDAGITFTPKGAYKYDVCAYVKGSVGTLNARGAWKLWDGTTTIAESEIRQAANQYPTIPVCGEYQAAGVAPVTLSLQCKADSGTCDILSGGTSVSSIEWSIKAINQAFPAPVVGTEARSEVWMDTYSSGAPYGSTNTEVFRYSNTYKNIGTAFTAASSTTLGHSITLNEAGLYCANGNYRDGGSTASFLIAINSTTASSGGQCISTGQTGAARNDNSCSACFIGAQGDVVRALGSGTTDQSSSAGSMVGFLRIVKISR